MGPVIHDPVIEYQQTTTDRAILVGIQWPGESDREAAEIVAELANLVESVELEKADTVNVKVREPHPAFLVGSGKAREISEQARALEANYIVFNEELTPSQQRNLERVSGCTVVDRHEIILDIFARRATTREATLQVEAARLEYSLPRLTNAWTHLSRQRGGARGTRGEGETQLETDRRIVLRRIDRIKKELEQVRKQRATRRKQRLGIPVPTGSIVGYTNAGKSSLLRMLTGAEVVVEDKLFATLDPTTRRIPLDGSLEVVLTDTVGFIRKLPHDLVDAFHSTLEETTTADFLVHVLDASSPSVLAQYATTTAVLQELGAANKPVIVVLNKSDLVEDPVTLRLLENRFGGKGADECVLLSAATGDGSEALTAAITRVVGDQFQTAHYRIPHARSDLAALLYRTGRVLSERYDGDHIEISAQVPPRTHALLQPFVDQAGA